MITLEKIPDEFRTNHLLLLVGANPLPNYVAALLLLADKGHLYLVHSERNNQAMKSGTYEIAQRLCTQLYEKFQKENKNFTHYYIPVNEADPADVYTKVQNACSRIRQRESVGLNYTGGTKVMAVHTYRALYDNANSARWKLMFSYLDAESMSLYLENSSQQQPMPVRDKVLVSIETLTKLHNETLVADSPLHTIILANLAHTFANVLQGQNMNKLWRDWLKHTLASSVDGDSDCQSDEQEEERLKQIELEWPHQWMEKWARQNGKQYSGALLPLQEALKAYFGLDSSPLFSLKTAVENAAPNDNLDSCQTFCKWLNGFWLEYYVLDCIRIIKEANTVPALYDFGRNLRTDKTVVDHNFELDIAAIVGYQFFAISCTTSTQWDINKSKLFEAYIRGRQLGGEEARIGFVTLMKGAAKLQKEVEEQWQAGGRIRIFDAKVIANLTSELTDWFNKDGRR